MKLFHFRILGIHTHCLMHPPFPIWCSFLSYSFCSSPKVTTQEGVGHNVGAVPCACPDSSFTPASKGRHKALPFGGYLNSYLQNGYPHTSISLYFSMQLISPLLEHCTNSLYRGRN